MKRALAFFGTLFFSLSVLVLASSNAQTNRSLVSTQARALSVGNVLPAPVLELTAECPDSIDGIAQCPLQGCGELGDALLNQVKNRVTNATAPFAATLEQLASIPQPASWDTGSSRASITGVGKEGSRVIVRGFLLRVKPEGGESCNCGLTRRVDTDIHLALASDPEDAEEDSVTAEITPRVRANGHDNWVFKNVKELEGEYVQITGWLMLDTKHIPQAHRLAHERQNKGLTRITNWEIHPVTKLEVCTKSKKKCNNGIGWESF